MSNHAVMPLSDYVDVCDAIRSKTGKTDSIVSGELSDKVNEVYDKGSYKIWSLWVPNAWLAHIEIPYGITKLGLCCFYYNQMASVTIPESVTTIENSVFSYCYKLKEVRLPSGLKNWASYIFSNCGELEKVIFGNTTGLSINNTTFGGCNKLTTIIIESGMLTQSCYFHQPPISVESMRHIIEHLTDYSADETNVYKKTIKFSDTCWNALEADSTAPNGGTWKEYVDSLGWLT